MNPGFRKPSVACACTLAAVTALGLAGCQREPSAVAAAAPKLPRPDLCQTVDRTVVETALLGKVTDCHGLGDDRSGYSTAFTGTVGKSTATLTVFYARRIDLKSGDDRWDDLVRQGKRQQLIGLGDKAGFDGEAAPNPQLVILVGDRVVSVGLNLSSGTVPQDQLAGHLLDLANLVLPQVEH